MKASVLVRPGCHLCDEALTELRAWLESEPELQAMVEVETVDIETDEELHRRYLERIPVIRIDGEDVLELFFDAEEFRSALVDRSRGAG